MIETRKQLVARYREILQQKGLQAEKFSDEQRAGTMPLNKPAVIMHSLWMLDQMEGMLEEYELDQGKFNRWLGWVQCAMALAAYYPVDKAREDLRSMN